MMTLTDTAKVYVYNEPVDMRKAIDGLSLLVVESLLQVPQSRDVYLFHNKSRDKVKALLWDKNGFILHYKRLEKGKFKLEKREEDTHYEITGQQLSWLFAGLDFMLMNEFSELDYTDYF